MASPEAELNSREMLYGKLPAAGEIKLVLCGVKPAVISFFCTSSQIFFPEKLSVKNNGSIKKMSTNKKTGHNFFAMIREYPIVCLQCKSLFIYSLRVSFKNMI